MSVGRQTRMDGSEGRLHVGREAGRPAPPTKSLGETGGWDPNDIQAVTFESTAKGFQDEPDTTSQGQEYAGLMTAAQHAEKKDQMNRFAREKAEIESDPGAYKRKLELQAELEDRSFKAREDAERARRLEAKRAKLAAADATADAAAQPPGAAGGEKSKKKGKKGKKKQKKEKKAIRGSLSFNDDEEDE